MDHSLDRRRFLQGAAAATAALSMDQTAHAAQAPSERIAVGIMGANGRGAALARGFASASGSTVAYVCDVDEQAIGKGMGAIGKLAAPAPKAVKDFRRILDDPAVDALVIAAPDHWHGPATILACAAGKHVYVEKPACHNGREGELMVAAARKHNRVVQMGSQRRSAPGVIEAIRRVHSGEIGRVLFARGWINSTRPNIGHGKVVPPPPSLDFELWQGPAPEQPYRDNILHYNWHWFWVWGTGELGNNGIHALDVCRWGLQVEYPSLVTCGGGKFFFDDDQETPDTQIATFNFGAKAINWEHRTWNKRGFEGSTFGITFYGDQGSVVVDSNKYAVYDMNGKSLAEGELDVNDGTHIANFLDGIRNGTKLNAEIAEGVASTALCHLGNIAYRTSRTIKFDPQKRQIIDDDEARSLWGRQYRPGWEPKV
jgi:predicted dehydrogenase